MNPHFLCVYLARIVPRQIKIGVVRRIEYRVRGSRCQRSRIVNLDRIFLRETIGHRERKCTGKALAAVRLFDGEAHRIFFLEHFCAEEAFPPAVRPRVEIVLALIFFELTMLAVERKTGPRNAVCVPPDDCAETARIPLVNRRVVVAEYHINRFSAFRGQFHTDPRRAEIRKGRGHARAICQCK